MTSNTSGKTLKPCFSEEVPAWIRFLDECFGYKAPLSYGIDFAPLFQERALRLSRLLWKDGEIIASATLYPKTIIADGGSAQVGIIGAVATSARHRNRGYSTELLRELEHLASSMSLDGLALWSDQEEFYARLGYNPIGHQELISLAMLPKPSAPCKGGLESGWDQPQVLHHYNKHALRLERSAEYWHDLDLIQSCRRFQWKHKGETKAYLAVDKGKDLRGIIHEWGGDRVALHHLVWALFQHRQELQWLTHPALHDPIRHQLVKQGTALQSGHLVLFKPLKPLKPTASLNHIMEKAWFWGLDSL